MGVFFFQAEDGIRDVAVTGVRTCALPIYPTFSHRLQTSPKPRHAGAPVNEEPAGLPKALEEDVSRMHFAKVVFLIACFPEQQHRKKDSTMPEFRALALHPVCWSNEQ